MYGYADLKEFISLKPKVECPVGGCNRIVERQPSNFIKREDKFKCPNHNIYISPSTFEYSCQTDNLLWKNEDDLRLFTCILTVKRESRIARDNSEDAVTWNVFRFLEQFDLFETTFSSILELPLKSPEVIYWSYSQREDDSWSKLNRTRMEFGETIERGSEPDIIVKAENVLLFIESKFTSGNKTVPSSKDDFKKYKTGGSNWFSRVFKPDTDYKKLAIEEKKYELMRLWLLGTWIANELGLKFYLLNLVCEEAERNIENEFGKPILEGEERKFRRLTWEKIYEGIKNTCPPPTEKHEIIHYFENKTRGYQNGQLRKAFAI